MCMEIMGVMGDDKDFQMFDIRYEDFFRIV